MEQARTDIRRVHSDPKAQDAESCDEYCDPACVHHPPSVGWSLSFGARVNFHPVDTTDDRLVVSLHLSDDAVATGMVYREVQPQQLVEFAHQLLALAAATTVRRHPLSNCGPLRLDLPAGHPCPTCGVSAGSEPPAETLAKIRELWPAYPQGFWR